MVRRMKLPEPALNIKQEGLFFRQIPGNLLPMMKRALHICPIFFLFTAILIAQPSALVLKDNLASLESEAAQASGEGKSLLLLQLAKTYYKDQNQEKAFDSFLKALDAAAEENFSDNDEDGRLYAEALDIYLNPKAQSTRDTAHELLTRYGHVVKQHPEYTQLGFLVAASYANTGEFADFFDLFYHSYRRTPRHYLSRKTKAIIHIKLFEKMGDSVAKEEERLRIIAELTRAAEIYPQDHTLYKMIIAFAPDSKKKEMVITNLKKIVDGNMVVPRTDIGFYVEESVKVEQYDAAQTFLNKAKEWYQYSKIINAAQEYLDKEKTRKQ